MRTLLLLSCALALVSCASNGEPQPQPRPSPAPTARPAQPGAGVRTLELTAPSGTSLILSDGAAEHLLVPGEAVQVGSSGSLRGRVGLNQLSEELYIPSRARAHLRGDDEGMWVEVAGRLTLGGEQPVELALDDRAVVGLLKAGELTLETEAYRLELRLD